MGGAAFIASADHVFHLSPPLNGEPFVSSSSVPDGFLEHSLRLSCSVPWIFRDVQQVEMSAILMKLIRDHVRNGSPEDETSRILLIRSRVLNIHPLDLLPDDLAKDSPIMIVEIIGMVDINLPSIFAAHLCRGLDVILWMRSAISMDGACLPCIEGAEHPSASSASTERGVWVGEILHFGDCVSVHVGHCFLLGFTQKARRGRAGCVSSAINNRLDEEPS